MPVKPNQIPIELLGQLLRYEPETGKLFWLPRPLEMFDSKRIFAIWNTRFSGKEAFIFKCDHGYLQGKIFGKLFRSHRVLWALHYGIWPDNIDHINGDRADNRLINLRSVSNAENQRNRNRSKANKSGITGVSWDTSRSKWLVTIMGEKKNVFLGYFDDKTAAAAKRKMAEQDFGYHPNHGRSM